MARLATLAMGPMSQLFWKINTILKSPFLRSQVCRVLLIQSALESSDPGASDGGLNVEMQPLGAVLNASKVVEFLQIIFFWRRKLFKSGQIGPKLSDFDVWPIIRRARGSAFQRTLHQLCRTRLRTSNLTASQIKVSVFKRNACVLRNISSNCRNSDLLK